MSASISNTVEITDASFNKPVFSQWETDRILYISGCASMPICRFAHPQLTHALVVNGEATAEDGMWKADVPNFLLQMNGPFFLSVVEERAGQIVEVAAAKYCVQPRMKPQDYEYTDNIGYVNWAVKAEEVQELIDEIQEKLDNGELKGDPFVYSDFTEEQLEDLKGQDGDDGISPVVTVSNITNGHRVTITDASHPTGQSFNVMDGEDVEEVFWAEYGSTTNAQIEAAIQAGKVILCEYDTRIYTLTKHLSTLHVFNSALGSENSFYRLTCNNDAWTNSYVTVLTTSLGPATNAPANLGTKAVGTAVRYAREDHVHQMPSAADVGAIQAPASASSGDILTYDGSDWVAQPGGGGGSVTVDDALSDSSTNPVQNKVVKAAVDAKYTKPATGIPASDLAAGVVPDAEVFWASYTFTTSAQVEAAYQAGKVVLCKYSGMVYVLTSRSSATSHTFTTCLGQSIFEISCIDNIWYDGSSSLAPLSSPTFTGTPKAPTAASGTNTTQIATTAFVQTEIAGKYTKPAAGIPATDLASAVQTSLGKADSALQSFTETDPTVPSWAKASSKPSYTASEVGAIAAPSSPSSGQYLAWNGTAWVAQSLPIYNGGVS